MPHLTTARLKRVTFLLPPTGVQHLEDHKLPNKKIIEVLLKIRASPLQLPSLVVQLLDSKKSPDSPGSSNFPKPQSPLLDS